MFHKESLEQQCVMKKDSICVEYEAITSKTEPEDLFPDITSDEDE